MIAKKINQGQIPEKPANKDFKESKPLKGNHMKLINLAAKSSHRRFSETYKDLVNR